MRCRALMMLAAVFAFSVVASDAPALAITVDSDHHAVKVLFPCLLDALPAEGLDTPLIRYLQRLHAMDALARQPGQRRADPVKWSSCSAGREPSMCRRGRRMPSASPTSATLSTSRNCPYAGGSGSWRMANDEQILAKPLDWQ